MSQNRIDRRRPSAFGCVYLRLMLVLLLAAPVVAQNQRNQPQRATQDVILDAEHARKQGDIMKAVRLFEVARNRSDFNKAKPPPELLFAVGDSYFAQGTLDGQEQAIQTYDLALTVWGRELTPMSTAIMRTRRAEVLSWQGKVDQARDEINALRTAYKDDRRVNLMADLGAANLLLLANQGDAARDALKPLAELNDDVIAPAALFSLGRAYVQLKQPDNAIASFRTLWNRFGESDHVKRAVYLIGQVYFDRGDFLEARKLYEACAVVGASMQTRVRPGDDLIVKVNDPDYFARTRSRSLAVTLVTPSGDEEPLRLEKNPVSDQLYVGRIQTALLMPNKGDGQLQVSGGDVIRMSYAGQSGKPYEVAVVDDGMVNIDSVELPIPKPRHERNLPQPVRRPQRREMEEAPVIPTGKLSSGAVSPGSPIYVQIIDADHDTTDQPDTMTAEVVATKQGKATHTITIQLIETGPRTGVFVGMAATEPEGDPAATQPAAPRTGPLPKDRLVFGVGHQVFARYVDEENENPGTKQVRESRRVGVRYHNASLLLAAVDGEGANRRLSPVWRIERDGRVQVAVTDPDVDLTTDPDSIKVLVQTESGDRMELIAEETGRASGTFTAALPLAEAQAALDNPRLLYLAPGDLLWMSYQDDRNLNPGYRTMRHHWVLENSPTAGDFASQPMVTTAWPFEVKPTADGEMRAVPREAGKGRVLVTFVDGDSLPSGLKTLTAKVNALLGETSIETTLQPTSAGRASRALDFILGDKDTASRLDAGEEEDDAKITSNGELSVAGDDIIRVATVDEKTATADLVVRGVVGEQALEGLLARPAEATPVIRLSDPMRRVMASQNARLDALKAEMGVRLLAVRKLTERFAEHRANVEARLKNATAEQAELIKQQLAAIDAQLAVLNDRTERLKALGAVEAQDFPPPPPAEGPAVPDPTQGALVPTRPFEVVVNDPDITSDTLKVRLRSVAGRLVDVLTVEAKRQGDGTYTARVETEHSAEPGDSLKLSLLPDGQVIADYVDPSEPMKATADRVLYFALASDATVRSLNPNYVDEVGKIRLGQEVYIEVVDYDADRSPALDAVMIRARSNRGDEVLAMLTETEPHSGVFRGLFKTDFADPVKGDDTLQAGYGGSIEVVYDDYLRQSPDSPITKMTKIAITGGSDGRIEVFSRQFRDSREEMELWYRSGQAAYQVGRKLYLAGAMGRAEEHLAEAGDYFNALITRFPEDALAASSNYYLGNIQSLRGNHREALARFNEVVQRWPKSEFVARARFKIGQSHEALGQFDQAADAYVLLTYHHPDDEHVPLAMIRMMNRYAKAEEWADAVAIAQRFTVKFPQHEQAGAVALKAGQWLTVDGKTNEALAWYASAEKTFATSDRDMPALLYWHAATMIQGQRVGRQGPRADKVRELLNRVVYDYGRSEYAGLARIALEQLNQQN